MYEILAEMIAQKSTAEWQAILDKADIPVMIVHSVETLLDDPHLEAVGFFGWMEHPTEGRIRTMAPAGMYSETPLSVRRPAPRLGEHTREVLAEAGLDESEITRLVGEQVVSEPDASGQT